MEQVIEVKTSQMLEADDSGTLIIPAELLGHPEPFTRFVVERVGGQFVIQPESVLAQKIAQQSSFDKWQEQWKNVQHEVSKSWPSGVSAADIISEMRR